MDPWAKTSAMAGFDLNMNKLAAIVGSVVRGLI